MAQQQYFYSWSAFLVYWDVGPKALVKIFKNRLSQDFGHGYNVKAVSSPYQGHVAIMITGFNKAATLSLVHALEEYAYLGKPKAIDIQRTPYGSQY